MVWIVCGTVVKLGMCSIWTERLFIMVDMVNHPPHYSAHKVFSRECIEYTRHMNFTAGNAFKYLYRQGQKFNTVEDLKKALWYISDEISFGDGASPIPDSLVKSMWSDYDHYLYDTEDANNDPEIVLLTSLLMILIADATLFDGSSSSLDFIEKLKQYT